MKVNPQTFFTFCSTHVALLRRLAERPGELSEAEATEAVDLARTTSGVRKVVKVFEYCKPTDAACAPRAP